jgi:hypothetical protein
LVDADTAILSRNERTGRWTMYDHRSSEEGVGTGRDQFRTTGELVDSLLGPACDWTPEDLVDLLAPFAEPAVQELLEEVRRRAAEG